MRGGGRPTVVWGAFCGRFNAQNHGAIFLYGETWPPSLLDSIFVGFSRTTKVGTRERAERSGTVIEKVVVEERKVSSRSLHPPHRSVSLWRSVCVVRAGSLALAFVSSAAEALKKS